MQTQQNILMFSPVWCIKKSIWFLENIFDVTIRSVIDNIFLKLLDSISKIFPIIKLYMFICN